MIEEQKKIEVDKLCPMCACDLVNEDHVIHKLQVNEYYNYLIQCNIVKKSKMFGVFEDNANTLRNR